MNERIDIPKEVIDDLTIMHVLSTCVSGLSVSIEANKIGGTVDHTRISIEIDTYGKNGHEFAALLNELMRSKRHKLRLQ